ncbi:MAG: type II secretion system protein [Myxococcota bacterium]
MTRPARSTRGLTLLEVLAATLIFALVMSVLVGASQMGVQRAGDAARRLEASQMADAIVADLEIQMRSGVAPTIEQEEWTSEDERYRIRVLDRSLQQALADSNAEGAGGVDAAAPAAGTTQIGGAGSGIGSLLAGELPEAAKHLHQYDVEVTWDEQAGPATVTRTTFAFDWEAAKVEFADLFPAAGDEAAPADGAGEANDLPDRDDAARQSIPDLRSPGAGSRLRP